MVLISGVVITVMVAWCGVLFSKPDSYNAVAISGGQPLRWQMLRLQSTTFNNRLPTLKYGIVNESWVAKPPHELSGSQRVRDVVTYESGWPGKAMRTTLWTVEDKGDRHYHLSGWDWWAWIHAAELKQDAAAVYFSRAKYATRVPLPLRPVWPGFALCVVFWSCTAWLAWYSPQVARERLRCRRGVCVQCAYELQGLQTCPECGTFVSKAPVACTVIPTPDAGKTLIGGSA
jgi:hypothetical protein